MRLSLFAPIDRWLAPAPLPGKVSWIREWAFAHRGLHRAGVPENSLAAALDAVAAGLGIECDIQRSSDAQPMVFHDWDLKRLLSNDAMTESIGAQQLCSMRYPGTAESPMVLTQLLDAVAGKVPLMIEIKSKRGYNVERSCELVRDALAGYAGIHAVMSFDPRVSRWFAQHSADTVRGLVVTEEDDKGAAGWIRRHIALWHARPDFLAYDIRDLPSIFAASQRARGIPVSTWTVRNPEQLAVAAIHADAPIAEDAGLDGVS